MQYSLIVCYFYRYYNYKYLPKKEMGNINHKLLADRLILLQTPELYFPFTICNEKTQLVPFY